MTVNAPQNTAIRLALACLTTLAGAAPSHGDEPMKTPQQLWANYDPRKEPLEIETIRTWTEGGSDLHEFYFTGETVGGAKARIYAIYGAPVGARGKLPAVLHIHGGGQPACLPWVTFFNKRGYAAMTFNWGGVWENRDRYALWPDSLKHCNHKYAEGKIDAVHPTPRESSWYHWTKASRRALTVLEAQKHVDPARLGIFGISMGGTLVWNVAGVDRRVKAACAIYGVGWNTYPASRYDADPKAADPDTATWRRTMEPEAYAPLVECPMLFLSGTNDFHGKMDWAYESFRTMKAPWRAAFTPLFNHHVAAEEGATLPLFMDSCLKGGQPLPATPQALVSLDADGVPLLTVRPDLAGPVAKVEAWYALKNEDPKNRFWRQVKARKKGPVWTASLPVLDPADRLFAFAQVRYEGGAKLASTFEAVVPAQLGQARATDEPSLQIADFDEGFDGFHTTSTGTDPVVFHTNLRRVKGPGGRWGVTIDWPTLMTRKLGDPKWRAPEGSHLAFEVHTDKDVTLKLAVKCHEFNPGAQSYQATLSLKPAKGWQKVALGPARFKPDKGPALKAFATMELLELFAENWQDHRPIFTNFHWIRPR